MCIWHVQCSPDAYRQGSTLHSYPGEHNNTVPKEHGTNVWLSGQLFEAPAPVWCRPRGNSMKSREPLSTHTGPLVLLLARPDIQCGDLVEDRAASSDCLSEAGLHVYALPLPAGTSSAKAPRSCAQYPLFLSYQLWQGQ